MRRKTEVLAALLCLAAVSAWAQAEDPPSRVARLNYMTGSVSFRPGSVEDWVAATLNYPLTNGDHLWTDPGALTEIHVGSTAIRMASTTAMSILNLDDRAVQLSLTEGVIQVRLRYLAEDESFEVNTPNVAITLLRPGDYRIQADGDANSTIVVVRAGDAEITGGGVAFTLHARQTARLTGIDMVTSQLTGAPAPDDFDRWCEERERRELESDSSRYVSREMTGYEDLGEYGTWSEVPEYGPVWAPRTVPVGWAPYRYGHWAWIEPWGWTWVDDAPWGFAPFHYGRWAYYRGRWCWAPGRVVVGVRPVYAPALVVFVGGRFGVPGRGGFAAWFPLGPWETYRPHYRHSERYGRNVNITQVTNVTVINGRYRNRDIDGAVTAVPARVFHSGRPIAREVVSVNQREITESPVLGTAPAIAPRRESVLLGERRSGPPSGRFVERTVIVRSTPPAPPVRFAAKERALESNQGKPLDESQLRAIRGEAPARQTFVRPVPQVRPAAVQPPVRTQDSVQTDERRFGRQRIEQPTPVERPRVVEPPRPAEPPRQAEEPRRFERPRPFETPRQVEQPRRVEQPRQEQPRQFERRTEQPRQEQPRQVERRPEPPRPVEQPRQVERSRPAEQPRQEPHAERPARTEKNEDQKPPDRTERRGGRGQ